MKQLWKYQITKWHTHSAYYTSKCQHCFFDASWQIPPFCDSNDFGSTEFSNHMTAFTKGDSLARPEQGGTPWRETWPCPSWPPAASAAPWAAGSSPPPPAGAAQPAPLSPSAAAGTRDTLCCSPRASWRSQRSPRYQQQVSPSAAA